MVRQGRRGGSHGRGRAEGLVLTTTMLMNSPGSPRTGSFSAHSALSAGDNDRLHFNVGTEPERVCPFRRLPHELDGNLGAELGPTSSWGAAGAWARDRGLQARAATCSVNEVSRDSDTPFTCRPSAGTFVSGGTGQRRQSVWHEDQILPLRPLGAQSVEPWPQAGMQMRLDR